MDVTQPVEAHVDAFNYTLGDVLVQNGHPIASESRKSSTAEKSYMVFEEETLATVHCLRVWQRYSWRSTYIGKTSNIVIDHFST